MTTKPASYHAYLLRCWREGQESPGGAAPWRFSVEEVLHERRRQGFASLESLLAFLRSELTGAEEEAAQGSRKEVP